MFAASITGRMDIAEEIVQELFYVFWKERERLQLFHTIKSYLYGAVRNQSLQYWEHQDVRNRYRDAILSHPDKDDTPDDPQEQIEYKELEALVNRSLSVKTVEAEMTKALRTLRDELEIYMKYD